MIFILYYINFNEKKKIIVIRAQTSYVVILDHKFDFSQQKCKYLRI